MCAFTRAYTHQVSHTRPHTITHTHLHTRKNTHTHTSKYTQMRAGWLCMCVPFTCLGLQDPDVRVVGSPPPGVCTCVRLWLVCVCACVCIRVCGCFYVSVCCVWQCVCSSLTWLFKIAKFAWQAHHHRHLVRVLCVLPGCICIVCVCVQ